MLIRIHNMRSLILSILLLTLIGCTNKIKEHSFFRYQLEEANDDHAHSSLYLDNIIYSSANLSDCLIKDSLIISVSQSDYLFDLTYLGTDELICSVCRKGRAENELLGTTPPSECFDVEGDICANLYSINENKFCLWNISKSLSSNRDVYDSMIKFNTEYQNVLMSIWRIDDSSILGFNSFQDPYRMTNRALPRYIQYDIKTGEVLQEYNLFNNVDIPDSDILKMAILSNVDYIKPDRKKIVFGMSYMPVLNILNLETGEVHGYILPDEEKLNLDIQRWCFADIAADNSYIYALFSGEEIYNTDGTDIPQYLYVFDWDGRIIKHITLNYRFTQLHIDGDSLFFTNPTGQIAAVKIYNL